MIQEVVSLWENYDFREVNKCA